MEGWVYSKCHGVVNNSFICFVSSSGYLIEFIQFKVRKSSQPASREAKPSFHRGGFLVEWNNMKKTRVPREAKIALSISIRELANYQEGTNAARTGDHTNRVFNLCKEILKYHSEADRTVVLVAAAFHDIGKISKRDGHEIESEKITKKYFKENKDFQKLSKRQNGLILEIIKNHSTLESELDPNIKGKIEFKILVDADRIDSFGPIGIIRASLDERFQKSAEKQLEHIKEKSKPDNYKLNSAGGLKVGEKYKTYLSAFEDMYRKQENIGC